MADRFPLIANSSANQIQEIPSGDQLNLSGNNIANAGVVTATTFSGSGASLTNLNGSNIASGTVPVARIGTGTKDTTTFYRGDGTFQVVNTDLVSDTSPQLGGSLDVNGHQILVGDGGPGNSDENICIGDGKDLKIYHDGNSVLYDNGVGDFQLFSNGGAIKLQKDTGENMVVANTDGAVELYEDNSLKLKTGVTGDYGSIQLQNGKNGWYGVSCNAQTAFMSDGNDIGLYNDTDNEWIMKGTRNGEVQLRYNDSIKLQTTSSGATVTGTLTANTFSGSGASLTNIPAGQLTGALPAISGSNLTGINQTVVQVKEYVCRDFETQSYSGNSQMATQLEGHITPTSSSNKIRITVCAFFMIPTQHNSSFQIKRSTNGGSSYGGLDATVQSSENVSRATGHIPSLWGRGHNWSDNVNSIATVIDSPNTTSQMYYRLFWMSNDSGTLQTNYNYDTSQTGNAFCKTVSILRLEEIASSAVTLTNIT